MSGVEDGCEPPGGRWEPNLGPLQEQPVLLTTESAPQPQEFILLGFLKFYLFYVCGCFVCMCIHVP